MLKFVILDTISNNLNLFLKNNIIDKKLLHKLLLYKNKIDNNEIKDKWDNAKKLSNSYELIYLPNKKSRINSIAHYHPLSRSYFKLWELIYDFNLIQTNNKLNVLCLAEGPGGFIEAIVNFRKKKNIQDNVYGISLKSKNKDIPGWKKSYNFLKKNPNVIVTNGIDDTGDLYNLDNIIFLNSLIKDKAEFITADGGFDFSIDFNKQEELSYRIIFCEIIAAFSNQKIEGCFVCKFFDINTITTIKMLYLLSQYYEKVYITKPLTSRPANSEKYIVCKNFKGIPKSKLKIYYNYIKNWDSININSFLSFINVPTKFIEKISFYNNILINNQIKHINCTIKLIENKQNKEMYNEIVNNQINKAKEWCEKYEIEINTLSCYLNTKNNL